MTSTPAGWYDDAHGAVRWWDGAQWTEHVQPAGTPAPPVPSPADVTQSAVELPPRAPAKRGWLIPVILGGAFVILVVLAIVFVPTLVKSYTSGGYTGDERAAADAVIAYDKAWAEGDCEAFEATTTEQFRTDESLEDCATFEEAAAGFDDATDDYEIEVLDVTSESGVITVRTDETFTSYLDEDSNQVPGYAAVSTIDYTIVEADGEWLIDSQAFVE